MNDNQKVAVAISIPAALLATLATCVTINVDTPKSDGGPTPVVDSGTVAVGEGEGEGEGEVAVGEGEGEGEGEKVVDAGTVKPPVVDVETPIVVDAGTSTPPPVGRARPAGNTGKGFFVDAGKLFDANGQEFLIRGINHTLWWGWEERNILAIPEIAKAGANSIRMTFGPGMGSDTAKEQRANVQDAISAKLVPVVTDMGATCKTDLASFEAVVSRWLEPERVAYLKEFEKFVILNIANEALGFDGAQWRDAYISAIQRLRAAGVKATIMVDAGGACGQNPRTVRDFGDAVITSDPEKNVLFSIHAYAYHRTSEATDVGRWNDFGTQSPWRTRDELAALQGRGMCVVMGEVGWEGSPQVGYHTKSMLLDLKALGVGFLAWSWSQNSDSSLDLLSYASPTNYLFRVEDLSNAGRMFILDPDVGLSTNAKRATIF